MVNNKVTLWCDRVMMYSFYALIYFIPISTALIESFSGVILTAYFVKRSLYYHFNLKTPEVRTLTNPLKKYGRTFVRSFKPVSSHLSWPIGMFILANFLSVIFSQYHFEGGKGFVTKLIQGTFLFFSFLECMKTKKQLKTFITIYCISVTLIVINGFVQYITGHGFIRGNLLWKGRIDSTFRHANDFAAYLVLVIPALFWLFISYRGRLNNTISMNHYWEKTRTFFRLHSKWLILVLLIISLISLGLTFSRGAWIAFILGIFYMCFYRKKTMIAGLIVICLFIGIFYPLMKEKRRVNFMTDVMPKLFNYDAALGELKEELESEKRKYQTYLADIKAEVLKMKIANHDSFQDIKKELYGNHESIETKMKRMEDLETREIFYGLMEKEKSWNFGGDDFSIDYWYYPKSFKDNRAHFSLINNIGNCLVMRLNGVEFLEYAYWQGRKMYWGENIKHEFQVEQWYHIALVRHQNDLSLFINGKKITHTVLPEETQLNYDFAAIGFWSIGDNNYGFLDGMITDFRIRKGLSMQNNDTLDNHLFIKLKKKKQETPDFDVETGKRILGGDVLYDVNSLSKKQAIVLHNQILPKGFEGKFEDYFLEKIYSRIKTASIEKMMEARRSRFKLEEEKSRKKKDLILQAKGKKDMSLLKSEGETQSPQKDELFSIRMLVSLLKDFGGSGRKGYWKEAMNMIKDHPFFGVGLNAYSAAVDKYKITWGGYPHNCYLQMAAEIGLIGLGTFLWILITFFAQAVKDSYVIKDKTLHAILIGFAGGVFAFMCHCFVDTNYYSTQLGNLMWIVMGVVVVASQLDSRSRNTKKIDVEL